jgi:N-acetylneuraminate synthase
VTALEIGTRRIGPGQDVYVVAEMSANHNHDLEHALAVVRAAGRAGADAIKLQTYTPDTMTMDSAAAHFVVEGSPWHGRRLYELYAEAHTPWEWHAPLLREAQEVGLDFFSTPFDASAVDYLERLAVPVYKVASFELVDVPLLRRIARTGRPVILSTGMATLDEISEAVSVLREGGCPGIALLKCTSAYPARPDEMDLATIPDLRDRFGLPVGLSDHTMDVAVPVAAVALGACIVEKHLTLSRAEPGPDSAFSLEPHEFKAMVDAVRVAARAIGSVRYGASERERASLAFRRSLFVVQDVAAGERFTPANVRCIRPGFGMHPRHLETVIGRSAARTITAGTPLQWELIDNETADAR